MIPLQFPSKFNVIDFVVQFSGVPTKTGLAFVGAQEQCWSDALPAATSNLYWYQLELNLGLPQSYGCSDAVF